MDNKCALTGSKIAVLGAGVMGAQIAAQAANTGHQVILFDLAAKEGPKNGIVKTALKRLLKLKPAPFMKKSAADNIIAANYDEDLALLKGCDFIIEAIAERLDLKEQLYHKIAPHLNDHAIIASNTSGLSINTLSESLPEQLRERFCGIHFFNPPRYMYLVELIASDKTNPELLNQLESFLVTHMGKGVIRAKDTPNFIANRVGVFSILNIFHLTEKLGLGFDVVDALTGPAMGRPKSATYRTVDVVGLDTLGHVIKTMEDGLTDDPWHACYKVPQWIQQLIEQGAMGQKTGAGIYRKQAKQIMVLDLAAKDYRPSEPKIDDAVKAISAIKNPAERLAELRASEHPQAQFLWQHLRDVFHYCAVHGAAIADNVRDIDLAIRWGFGWQQGPFELWQACGWETVAAWIQEDINAGKTTTDVKLPAWVNELQAVYDEQGAYNFASQSQQVFSQLPVYERQIFPPKILGQETHYGETIFENDDFRLWHQNDGIAIASFKTKNHILNHGVIDGVIKACRVVEAEYDGLVIWQPHSDNFCYGADLKTFSSLFKDDLDGLRQLVAKFHEMVLTMRYAKVPVVTAIRGLVLGGGVEVCLHSDRIVAAAETYMGLVEAGVGLLPAGGGSKELALRAFEYAEGADALPKLQKFFEQIAMAKVAGSAFEAKDFHYLRDSDVIVMNPNEILYTAKAQVQALNAQGYRPPVPPKIKVVGRPGLATLQMFLVNMREGHFISDYDYFMAKKIATVLCGGDVDANTVVDEQWLLNLEIDAFVELASQEKTLARVMHTLTTGKPLRN